MVRYKGSGDRYAVNFAVHVLEELGFAKCVLQCDQEIAVMDLCKAVAGKYHGDVQLRTSPVASHQSAGAVERHHQAAQSMCRTLLAGVEEKYGITVTEEHILLPWAVRHGSWLYVRYQRRANGQTAFSTLRERPYSSEIFVFGETVWAREETRRRVKALPDGFEAIWVGRSMRSDEHLLLTTAGVV
jgi:hypothetical protein